MLANPTTINFQRAFTMLEVLITIIILSFGMLGLASLQAKIRLSEAESYQRSQAVLLLKDMLDRMSANRVNGPSYLTGSTNLGTDDTRPSDCTSVSGVVGKDICEWSNALRGTAETNSGTNAGAMIDARGCIEEIQAVNSTTGICRPGVYRVTVAWQGLNPTVAPSLGCGRDLYGDERVRRAVSAVITIGLPKC